MVYDVVVFDVFGAYFDASGNDFYKPMDPVPGASTWQGDFQDEEAEARIIAALGGKADLVLSDMAPNTTGHAATDHLRIMALAELALDFALKVLGPGGGFVAKVFQGGSEKDMHAAPKRHFARVRHVKPPSSRKEPAELYVVGTGFLGRSACPMIATRGIKVD